MDRHAATLLRHGWLIVPLCCLAFLSGCQPLHHGQARLPAPVETRESTIEPARIDVVGAVQITQAREEDTFPDLARRFNIGFQELDCANPGVYHWTPHAGTEIVIPTRFILPDAPRTGIVINLAAMRLFYFPPARDGEPQRVITHPLGIGRVAWRTPLGTTRVVSKTEAPTWIPPPSILTEHAGDGDSLPAVVPPGPDNPMGTHALRLGWPKYAIHGTNKPPSIGLRGTHGCLRMYPEDIVSIYEQVPVGTPVRVVNQPQLFGWHGNTLFGQAYPPLEEDRRDQAELQKQALATALKSRQATGGPTAGLTINHALLDAMIREPRAIAMPITEPGLTLADYLARAARVENTPPPDASWQGFDRGLGDATFDTSNPPGDSYRDF